jgi:hypothetical protein
LFTKAIMRWDFGSSGRTVIRDGVLPTGGPAMSAVTPKAEVNSEH